MTKYTMESLETALASTIISFLVALRYSIPDTKTRLYEYRIRLLKYNAHIILLLMIIKQSTVYTFSELLLKRWDNHIITKLPNCQ